MSDREDFDVAVADTVYLAFECVERPDWWEDHRLDDGGAHYEGALGPRVEHIAKHDRNDGDVGILGQTKRALLEARLPPRASNVGFGAR